MELLTPSYTASVHTNRTRWYIGALFTFLATGKDTNGQFAYIEALMRKGLEPPPHMHTKEDETFYLLEGEVKMFVGDHECYLKPNEFIYLPKNIPHRFEIQTDTARMLIHTSPAGLEEMFFALSIPAEKLELPPRPSGPPSTEFLQKLGALQQQYGIVPQLKKEA